MTTGATAVHPPLADARSVLRSARRRFLLALGAVAVLTPLVLAGVRWPAWWSWIAAEDTPMTWLQSVDLVLCAAGSALVALLLRLQGQGPARRRPWALLTAGFAALAFDERFSVHERVRDGVLAPRGVRIPFLPWIAPGDFLLVCVALVGLAVLPMVLRAVAGDHAARLVLFAGVGLALVAVGLDSVDPSTWSEHAERVQQTSEEVIEMASGLCFLAAVGLRLLAQLAGTLATQRDLT